MTMTAMVIIVNSGVPVFFFVFFFVGGLKNCVYERERLAVSGVAGIALPECDQEGNYKPVQCSYGWDLKCWCADQNGNAYWNTSVYSGTPDCTEEGTVGYT